MRFILSALLALSTCAAPSAARPDYHKAAIQAGWTEAQWPTVRCIIQRESGGNPTAHNPNDPGYGSYGLTQLNMTGGAYGTWTYYKARLGTRERLFDPLTNLVIARDMFNRSVHMYGNGWRPWGGGCR